MNWRDDLAGLHSAATGRVEVRPTWTETTRRAREISTVAVIIETAGLAVDELHDAAIDRLAPEVAAALARIAPSFDITTIASYPPAALRGLGNAVKGSLFEMQVAEGVIAGDIELPSGVTAFRLVDDFFTPGYDAQLLDDQGHVVDVIQLKTSQTAAIISDHFDRYPTIEKVWTSHEAAVDAANRGLEGVFDTQISDSDLAAVVHEALVDQATTSALEVIDELIPQVTYAIIAVQAGWRLMQGEPAPDVISWARRRVGSATAMSAVAGLASIATGTDLVRIPVVVGISVGRLAYVELDGAAHRLDLMRAILESFQQDDT